jgi:hypothetical protein
MSVKRAAGARRVLTGAKVIAMLLTLIAMQSAWLAWREYQQRKSARRRLLLASTNLCGSRPTSVPLPPFWNTLLARYRREMTVSRDRRVRTRKAIERINMAAERKSRGAAHRP